MRAALTVAIVSSVVLMVTIIAACGGPPAADPWRADDAQLLVRVDRLATAGDVAAAGGVLSELERRGAGTALDRGRVALARGLLAAGQADAALERLRQVAWADKSPAIAGELVGLELAIRWRGLLAADGALTSGMQPPRDAADSDRGRPGGTWQARREAFAAIAAVLAGPARMVEREGGSVALPAEAGLLSLARYAHGAAAWEQTATDLGPPARWSPPLALAVLRLHLAEHDPGLAAIAAEALWARGGPEAGTAFRELRTWQLRRRTAARLLAFWPYPELDARLDALAARFAGDDAAARRTVALEADLGDAVLPGALRAAAKPPPARMVEPAVEPVVDGTYVLDVESAPAQAPEPDERPMSWLLARHHDGLRLHPCERTVATGAPLPLDISGDYAGPFRLELWRIDDAAAWDRLCRAPTRADLPAQPVWSTVATSNGPCPAPPQPEGRYVATLHARACPVVVLESLRVSASAIHVEAGAASVVAWAVDRRDGRGLAALPLAATFELVRTSERAAGAAWAGADPAWRSGFAQGFTGVADTAWRGTGQEAAFAAGLAAGRTAATADPPLTTTLRSPGSPGGVWQIAVPERLAGRSWTVTVRADTPGSDEAARAAWGAEAQWTSRAVAWADKPFVRPGEPIRFAALLREHDGDGYRLPVGAVTAELRVGDERIWSGELAIGACGLVSHAAVVPPGAADGAVTLRLGEGAAHHLAQCERLALPPVTISVVEDPGASLRAGEPHAVRVRVRDAAGAPLAKQEVCLDLRSGGSRTDKPQTATTDLAGEAAFSVPTAAGEDALYRAVITTERDGRRWLVNHDWRVSPFPFPLTVELPERRAALGGTFHVRLLLPAQARVQVALGRGDVAVGAAMEAVGGADGRAEVLLPATVRADAVRVSCPVLGGGEAVRSLAVTVWTPEPAAASTDPVACLPERTRLEPGQDLAVAVGCTTAGRDALLIVGARSPIAVRSLALRDNAERVLLGVGPGWGPECHVQALAWLPGRGFTASRRSTLTVLPTDRLLQVEIELPQEPRPGEHVAATVRVRDWRGAPVAGAALTLGVVDDRVFALAEDRTPDLLRYFHDGHRPWQLLAGNELSIGMVSGQLWRSVVRRWQPVGEDVDHSSPRRGGMFGSRAGAGRRASLGEPIRTLGGDADPCIAWVAGLLTGADGSARVEFTLPAQAAGFRLTARAADASPAVLVGEVRTAIRSRHGLGLHLAAPAVLRPGDRVQLTAELANHRDAERKTVLTWTGGRREVGLGVRTRRAAVLDLTVPEADPAAPVVRLGDLLGHELRLTARLEDGAESVDAECRVLLPLPGIPETRSLRLVAAPDGTLTLPVEVPAGAAVELALRAWPDAAARRADELLRWRGGTGPAAAAAWLVAAPGRERRDRLAALWPTLNQEAAATALRLAAVRRGQAGGGIDAVPEGLVGDWLLASGRATGLGLPAPRLRGVAGNDATGRAAAAACALAEGWSEGRARWRQVREELAGSNDAPALAIALDAARLAGDDAAAALLAARLVQVPWTDPLVQVLVADLLPESTVTRPALVTVGGAGAAVELDGGTGALWRGVLVAPLRLRAPPGSLVALDLRWQAAPPAVRDDDAPRLQLWQADGDGFRPLAPGAAAWPGRQLALTLDTAHCRRPWTVRLLLPTLLRPVSGPETVRLLDAAPVIGHSLGAFERERLHRVRADGGDVRAALDAALAGCLPMTALASQQRPSVVPPPGQASDAAGVLILTDRALLLADQGEGVCTWPAAIAEDGDGRRVVLAGPGTLRIAADAPPQRVALVPGHPQAARIHALAARLAPVELDALIDTEASTPAEWNALLARLDPDAPHTLDDLLAHPLLRTPGHWSQSGLRRHLDAEPAFDAPPAVDHEEPTLAFLVARIAGSRRDRELAWRHLLAPAAVPARTAATLRAWHGRLVERGLWPREDFATWLWRQELDPSHLSGLGCDTTVDGWLTWLRRECGVAVRLGTGTSATAAAPSGDGLGTAALGQAGLILVALPDGGFELRSLLPDLRAGPATISLDFQDRPIEEAVAAVNELLLNRGLPPLSLSPQALAASPPPVTLRVKHLPWTDVLDFFMKVTGLTRQGRLLTLATPR